MEAGTANSIQGTFYSIMYCQQSLFSVSVIMCQEVVEAVMLCMKILLSLFMCKNWNALHLVIIGYDHKCTSKEYVINQPRVPTGEWRFSTYFVLI